MDRRMVLGQFAVGGVVGMVASLGISLNLMVAIAAVVIVVGAGFVLPRFAFLAGGLLGIGLTWFVLMMGSMAACRATEDYCGHANDMPMIVISVVLIGAALFFGAVTVALAWRRRPTLRR